MTHDAKRADASEPIVVECHLDAPPKKVWRALTDPDLLAAWLAADSIRSEDGGCRLRLGFGEAGHAVVLETLTEEPHRRLRYRWRGIEGGALPDLDSVVTFELTPSDAGGTHLRIVHDGFSVTLAAPVRQPAFMRRPTACGVRGACGPRPARRRSPITMRLAA
jgi:uncharacterized protein YndB with AHSA1/START domain